MSTASNAQFTVGHCSTCADHVLTYIDLGDDGSLVHKCLGCDAVLGGELHSVASTDLAEHGYEVAETGGGCGGGCSSGCGVRPPAPDSSH